MAYTYEDYKSGAITREQWVAQVRLNTTKFLTQSEVKATFIRLANK